MPRCFVSILVAVLSLCAVEVRASDVVVADSVTRIPLPNASIYDRSGRPLGMTDRKGLIPQIPTEKYPVIIRYVGFNDRIVPAPVSDTIFLQEDVSILPEFTMESRNHRVLHILAFVREYSTMTTYTDTLFLFREKMVDYMLTPDEKIRFNGWATPRVLTSRSYYRFTDATGRDSVSDTSPHHFSWTDWVGVPSDAAIPSVLRSVTIGTDTIRGKYSPTEIWNKEGDRISIGVDVLADSTSRKWVPNLSAFFRKNIDFERFRITFKYDNVTEDAVSPMNLTGYSYNIESNGRGRDMFRFNRYDEPFFVSTDADVYILDKEYITVKEARKWAKRNFTYDEVGIYEPLEAPEVDSTILNLIARVGRIDKEQVRLEVEPDRRLVSENLSGRNFKFGRRVLSILKTLTGISAYKSRKNMNREWNKFKKGWTHRNSAPSE